MSALVLFLLEIVNHSGQDFIHRRLEEVKIKTINNPHTHTSFV